MTEWIRERLVALIEEGRVSSQAEAARLLGVSKETVNKVVLSYGLGLKYTRPPRPVLICKTCSRRYHPTPMSRGGICVPCQWVAKQRGGPAARAKTRTDPTFNDTSRASTTRNALFLLLEQGPIASQSEAARRLGVSRQAISQIVLAEGLDLRRTVRRRSCSTCGKRYYPSPGAEENRCASCAQVVRRITMVCPGCGSLRTVAPSVYRQRKSQRCNACRLKDQAERLTRLGGGPGLKLLSRRRAT